jgi:hypothetical protein
MPPHREHHMNCDDITYLLDESDLRELPAADVRAVEAHLATCAACAAQWRVQLHFAAVPAPPVPAGLLQQALQRADAGRLGSRRMWSRGMLGGAVLAVAAAAMMLVLQVRETGPTPGADASASLPAEPAAAAASLSDVLLPGEATLAAAPPASMAPAPAASETFTVRVHPLVVEGDGTSGIALFEAFRANLIARLHVIPGLLLLDAEPRDASDIADHEIRIRVMGDGSSRFQSARIEVETSALLAGLAEGDARQRLEYSNRLADTTLSTRPSAIGIIVPAPVSFPTVITLSAVLSAAGAASATEARIVESLRVHVFPWNDAFHLELLSRVGDGALADWQRVASLGPLLALAQRHDRLDGAIISAGGELALAAGDLDRREITWELLRLTAHPALIPFLVRGVAEDPEDKVRLQIVQILSTDFASNPAAQAALQEVSQDNSRQVVQMAAVRELGGGAGWETFAVQALHDAARGDLQRLQPIADMAASIVDGRAPPPRLDDAAAETLATVLMRAARDNSESNTVRDAARDALTVLAAVDSPRVPALLVDIMRMPDPEPPGLAMVSVQSVKTSAMQLAASRFPRDPGVRAAVEALANDPTSMAGMFAGMHLRLMDLMDTAPTSGAPDAGPPTP